MWKWKIEGRVNFVSTVNDFLYCYGFAVVVKQNYGLKHHNCVRRTNNTSQESEASDVRRWERVGDGKTKVKNISGRLGLDFNQRAITRLPRWASQIKHLHMLRGWRGERDLSRNPISRCDTKCYGDHGNSFSSRISAERKSFIISRISTKLRPKWNLRKLSSCVWVARSCEEIRSRKRFMSLWFGGDGGCNESTAK